MEEVGFYNKLQVHWSNCFKPEILQGPNKPLLQLSQCWGQFEVITTYLLDQRWSWCAPLLFPYYSVCPWIIDLDGRARGKGAGLWDEMLPEATEHFVQGPCYQWGGSQKDPNCYWRIWWTPDPCQETETMIVWPRLNVFWFSKDYPTGHRVKGNRRRDRRRGGKTY